MPIRLIVALQTGHARSVRRIIQYFVAGLQVGFIRVLDEETHRILIDRAHDLIVRRDGECVGDRPVS